MSLTDFYFVPAETYKSDKTDLVSNQAFLQTVFGDALDAARPIVVSFSGNPAHVPSKSWFGRPWYGNTEVELQKSDRNNYFSLAMFQPDETGHYRRQKSRFVALCAVMLDDIGGKVEMDRLTLAASWLLETSPGNHQAGYLLSEQLTNGNLADRLMNAIVNAGLCDPGANGPRARLARLPVAINGKHTLPFRCRMVSWLPEKRYSVEELIDGLQLEIAPVGRPKRQTKQQTCGHSEQEDLVWIPRPEENQVISALRVRGLYKAPLGDGKHDISCPWVEEHTDAVDGGTAYFDPDDSWPLGGFKCLHGHCAERHIRDLLRVLDVDISAARIKPIIRIVAGEFHRVVDAAERELAQSGRHYQRGGLIVCVATDPGTGETKVQEVSQAALVPALAGAAI
ncbi:MAG: hypothetical protein ACU836_06875 [Gammaproteobacteria bacterium]